ncbi:anti-sigma factor antagonist [Peribacillus alkalitolerans]|uniref:anti-sigma factor antagonist n=1 Tax=Peribacillus alkalitolerans TaxID=1550385 RepID=UPI0013D55F02|nr:anti-sigma factor antagonist [Peribacillus alkalitolerans]
MNITIDVKDVDAKVEVKVKGEIDAYTAPKLRESLFPLSEQEKVKMTVNLSEVTYMDSTGLGVFVGLFKNVRAYNGDFAIEGLSDRLKRLFDITGLGDIINIKSDAEGEQS